MMLRHKTSVAMVGRSRGRTAEQKRLGVKILNFDPKNI